jgi:hypothetical protein
MPPQEGVHLGETFEEAAERCMRVECGITFTGNLLTTEAFHYRVTRHVGKVALPPERSNERPVADNAHGTVLERIKMRSKSYWTATILVTDVERIDFTPDGKELVDLKWFGLDDARKAIRETNHPEKGDLLLRVLDQARRDLFGNSPPTHRASPSSKW